MVGRCQVDMSEAKTSAGAGAEPAEVPPEQHHDLYGELYYDSCLSLRTDGGGPPPVPYRWGEPVWEEFFTRLAGEIVDRLHPRTVLDAGCAIGFLVKSLRDRGVKAEGFDSSAWAISQVIKDARPFCRVASITDEIVHDYDLITCIEVVEHVTPKEAAAAVANLCRHGRAVLFSSTPDHFDEVTHINVHPPDHWAGLFADQGFYRDLDFDASFVAPHAALFRPAQHLAQVVRGYERRSWEVQRELRGVLAHRDHMYAELQKLVHDRDLARAQLRGLASTKTFRVTARLRALWASTGGKAASRNSPPGQDEEQRTYDDWIRRFDTFGKRDRERLGELITQLASRPTFSMLMPVFNPQERHLRLAIESVLSQLYPDWELCIADDASTEPHVRASLEEYRERDQRIKVTFRPTNGRIAVASNSALALATGEFLVLFDHDDVIPAHALACLALELAQHPSAAILYSDEDKLDEHGRRYAPYFKPAWNPELFLGQNYLSHLGAYRRELVVAAGGFRAGFEGSQDYDLALRVSESVEADQIRHIPLVLYHWRAHQDSAASSALVKPYARSASVRAVADHLARSGPAPDVGAVLGGGVIRVRWPLPTPAPQVSILVAGDDPAAQTQTMRSLWFLTEYPNYQVERATRNWLSLGTEEGAGVFVEPAQDLAPASLGATEAGPEVGEGQPDTDVICVVREGVEAIEATWLREMVAQLFSPGVGLVGARLDRSDGVVALGPLAVESDGTVQALLDGLGHLDGGYWGRPWLVHSVASLSPGCLVIRRSVLEEIGGLDPELEEPWRTVDLSLRVRESAYRVVWTPNVRLSVSAARAGSGMAGALPASLLQKHAGLLSHDPGYSPNLSLEAGRAFTRAWPPRQQPAWAPRRASKRS